MEPEISAAGAVRIGEWLVEPSLNRLSRGESVVHIRPKAMDVLVLLARQPGLVVSREAIIDAVWARTFIADSALASAISELRKALADDVQKPVYIETIQKRGYRLLADVARVEGCREPGGGQSPAEHLVTSPHVSHRALVLSAATILTVVSVVGVLGLRQEPLRSVSLAVVPFENLGPEEGAYFAAGVSEEITATLSTIPGLHVVTAEAGSRVTAAVAGTPAGGAGSDVAHVLRGSVRWAGSARDGLVRITPQLISARDGATEWSRVYERSIGDVFAVQTDIAREVALHLDLVLTLDRAGTSEAAGTAVPEAHEAYLRGLSDLGDLENGSDQLRAVRLFEQAVARDPAYVAAYVALARTNALLYHFGIDRSPQRLAAARQACSRLAEIAPDRRETLVASAYLAFAALDYREAAARFDAAGPGAGFPFGRGFRADIERRLGRFDDALELYREWLDSSPIRAAYVHEQVGTTAGFLGRWEEADAAYAAATDLDPARHQAYAARAHNALLWRRSVAVARAELDRDPAASPSLHPLEHWLLAVCSRDWETALAVVAGLPAEGVSTQFQRVPPSLLAAETYRLRGDTEAARTSFEASRATLEHEVAENPDDFRRHSALGLAYAGLGRRDDAARSGERALTLCPVDRDAVRGAFYLEAAAQGQVMTGELDAAAATLDRLLAGPHHPSATPVLDLDPRWEPLRTHPAYPRLLSLAGSGSARAREAGPRTAAAAR